RYRDRGRRTDQRARRGHGDRLLGWLAQWRQGDCRPALAHELIGGRAALSGPPALSRRGVKRPGVAAKARRARGRRIAERVTLAPRWRHLFAAGARHFMTFTIKFSFP